MPLESPQLPSRKANTGHTQKTITRVIQNCRAARIRRRDIESDQVKSATQLRHARLFAIVTPAASTWIHLRPGLYEFPVDTWSLILMRRLGAPIYAANAICAQCHSPVNRLGDHAFPNYKSRYGRSVRRNTATAAIRRSALFESAIFSTREPAGLMPGATDRPANVFVPTETS